MSSGSAILEALSKVGFKLRLLRRHTQSREAAPDPCYLTLLPTTTCPLPARRRHQTTNMSSDYEISDDENEYYDEEDDEMEVDYDDGAHILSSHTTRLN